MLKQLWLAVLAGTTCLWFSAMAAGQEGTTTEASAPSAEVADLLERLGDDYYGTREEAKNRLVALGLPVKPFLQDVLDSPDPEVRRRAKLILDEIIEQDYARRLKAFEDDPLAQSDPDLPCWKRFRDMVGDSPADRKLFVMMHRAEGELLLSVERQPGDDVTKHLQYRCRQIQLDLAFNNGSTPIEPSLGSLATLYFVAAQPDVSIPQDAASQLGNLSYRPGMQQALTAGDYSAAMRSVLSAWVGRRLDSNSAYQNFMIAMRYNLPSVLEPAVAAVQEGGRHSHVRLYGLLVVGRFGNKEHWPVLEKLLDDKSVCLSTRINNQPQPVQIQVRDVALAVLVKMSGQKLADYGFTKAEDEATSYLKPYSLSLADEKAREAGIEKWKKWAGEQPR